VICPVMDRGYLAECVYLVFFLKLNCYLKYLFEMPQMNKLSTKRATLNAMSHCLSKADDYTCQRRVGSIYLLN